MPHPLTAAPDSAPSDQLDANAVRGAGVWRYRLGYGTAAVTYLAMQAFSTVPSPLYPVYAARDHLSALMITVVYAAYAVGVAASLVLAGHLSDVWGRRPVLAVAVLLNAVAAWVFVAEPVLSGLFVARIVCGLAVGITASTATAYLTELCAAYRPVEQIGRVRMLSASTAVGGLGLGALLTGLIAAHVDHPLTLPYVVMLGVFAACLLGLAVAPETRAPLGTRPGYHPQRVTVPAHARRPFLASLTGVATVFAIFGLFVGLAGTVLGQVLHRHSVQLSGIVLFVLFGTGALCTVVAVRIGHRVLVILAGLTVTVGLGLLVLSVWLPAPSLALFIVAGAVIGAGGSALFTASLTVATAVAPRAHVAETLAGFFLAGYLGISVPVVGTGMALQHLSARTTLLSFAILLTAGLVTALPSLARTNVPRLAPR
jgi:MFS family permease